MNLTYKTVWICVRVKVRHFCRFRYSFPPFTFDQPNASAVQLPWYNYILITTFASKNKAAEIVLIAD